MCNDTFDILTDFLLNLLMALDVGLVHLSYGSIFYFIVEIAYELLKLTQGHPFSGGGSIAFGDILGGEREGNRFILLAFAGGNEEEKEEEV